MRLVGRELHASRRVLFRGGRGPADDVGAAVSHRGPKHLEVAVPVAARTGRVDIVNESGSRVTAARRLRVTRPEAMPGDTYFVGDPRRPSLSFEMDGSAAATVEVVDEALGAVVRRLSVEPQPGTNLVTWDGRTDDGVAQTGRYALRLEGGAVSTSFSLFDHVFPIRGRHDLGQSATNNFGGGRGHQGQDMFASCGTPLVAARGGRVRESGFNGAAGNYAVITSTATGFDYVYMHMRKRPLVRKGDRVATRQPIGEVGRSGNASGCHLHFELWNAPGWYAGGKAFDPLPLLQAWDGWS